MPHVILGLIWVAGSWKTTIKDYIDSTYPSSITVTLSSTIKRYLSILKIEQSGRGVYQEMWRKLRHKFGEDYIARRATKIILQKIRNRSGAIWVLDGIRSPREMDTIRWSIPGVFFIWVDAHRPLLLRRMKARWSQKDTDWDEQLAKMIEKEYHSPELWFDVSSCLLQSDIVLQNNWTKDELINSLKKTLNHIMPTYET